MQQMLVIVSMALLAFVAARPAVNPSLFPAVSPFGVYPGAGVPYSSAPYTAAALGNPLGASPLAVSSSQRLDYFNQFNAAFAPTVPARLLAAGAPFSGPFPAAAPERFIQPARLIAPGVAAPFFF